MHLWPSLKLRDSFKSSRLKNKLHRTNSSKQNPSNQQNLLGERGEESSDLKSQSDVSVICRDIVLILSCFHCCFCCGACIDQEEN